MEDCIQRGTGDVGNTVAKKSKKRPNLWTKTTSRKSAKKITVKSNGARSYDANHDNVLLKPFQQEDDPSYPILLSKIYKAEKIELNADRLAASGSKGYRMVRATRGVSEGAWYFEIYVEKLGKSGHTRLGWSTRRGDIQAPVGYDVHSYAYRDLDGTKVHGALREQYGQRYCEKDVIGFYINLPREEGFTRKAEDVVGFKGQPYVIVAEEPLKPLSGSELLFFKNGECQGVAYRDINDGTYFPAASMYTLPSQDYCKVVFNFGPDFKYPFTDVGARPLPLPMCQASRPGEARLGEAAITQTAVAAESADVGSYCGSKQRMTPDCMTPGEDGHASTRIKEGKAPKPFGSAPVMKTKTNIPKVPVGNTSATLAKNPKSGESRLNLDFRQDMDQKVVKKVGFLSARLPIQKTITNDSIGEKVPDQEMVKKVQSATEIWVQKLVKKDSRGAGLVLQKGFRKGIRGTSLQDQKIGKKDTPGSGTGLLIQKGIQRDTIVPAFLNINVSKKDMAGTGVGGFQGRKGHMTGNELPGHEGYIRDTTGIEWHRHEGNIRNMAGTQMPFVKVDKINNPSGLHGIKGIKKDPSGAVLPVSQPSKKSFLGTGPALLEAGRKKKLKTRFGLGGMVRPWEEGIRGAMDVDVVVVESSLNLQADSSLR